MRCRRNSILFSSRSRRPISRTRVTAWSRRHACRASVTPTSCRKTSAAPGSSVKPPSTTVAGQWSHRCSLNSTFRIRARSSTSLTMIVMTSSTSATWVNSGYSWGEVSAPCKFPRKAGPSRRSWRSYSRICIRICRRWRRALWILRQSRVLIRILLLLILWTTQEPKS